MIVRIESLEPGKINLKEIISRSELAGVKGAEAGLKNAISCASHVFVGYIYDKIVCVYGVNRLSLLSGQCYIWLLTTKDVDEHKFIFIRHSQLMFETLLKDYQFLTGETHRDDRRAQKWLRWLGAEYGYPEGEMLRWCVSQKGFKERRWLTR